MTRLLSCIVAVVTAAAFALPASATETAANPQRQLLVSLADLLQRQPRHIGAIYVAARTAAALNDDAEAIRWLDRLAEVGFDDELDPDDFGAFAQTAAYRERAARFAAQAPPVGRAARSTS